VPGGSYTGPGGLKELRGHPAAASRSAAASDMRVAGQLWELSERLTGVSFGLAAAGA